MHKNDQTEYFLQLEKDVIEELKEAPQEYQQFLRLNEEWRQRFLDFCTGKKTLPLTYDPFFKTIFHPDIHPQRLSRLISSLIQREVKVVRILPTEDNLLGQEALLIMDILVELEDGSLANVEVQKIPCFFPGERMSCYSADLLLRQYSRVKSEKGKYFKYNDLRKVYTIIIFEKSISAFHEKKEQYIHMGKPTFDSGLKLELLQEYCLVALDVFKKIPYPKERSERTAWLGLLATESVEEALELAEQYPWLVEIYKEMTDFMRSPKEVLNMFSEALHILDRNTVNYMIEEQQAEIEAKRRQIEENQRELEEKEQEIKESKREIEEKEQEIKESKREIEEKNQKIEAQKKALEAKDKELEHLRKLLKAK